MYLITVEHQYLLTKEIAQGLHWLSLPCTSQMIEEGQYSGVLVTKIEVELHWCLYKSEVPCSQGATS